MTLALSHSSSSNHFLSPPFSLSRRTRWPLMNSFPSLPPKILLLMGATASGKSRLSLDLATRLPSEIINSDKMQLYNALDITTNKLPLSDRRSIPHHLLGAFDPLAGEVTAAAFRSHATSAISDIVSRGKHPLIVGGSNSFIHALVVSHFNPDSDVFTRPDPVSTELRYRCCFLWVDVSFPVLSRYLSKRVDDMLEMGMFEELAEFYDPVAAELTPRTGLRKAIGVPEFDRFFKRFHRKGRDRESEAAYEEAVRAIKENTCQLTKRQLGKIVRLEKAGWGLQRVDATAAVEAVLAAEPPEKWSEIWERDVVQPSMKIVKNFFQE